MQPHSLAAAKKKNVKGASDSQLKKRILHLALVI